MGLSTTYTKAETDFLIQQLEEKASDKYNNESNSIANDVIKFIDINTGEDVNYRETTTWHDGSAMDDSKVDGVIYIKKNSKYYKRQIDSIVNVKWFGAKGDGVTDDTYAIQQCFDFADKYKFNVILDNGIFKITQTINISGEISVDGHHQYSVIRPHSCDAFNILASNGVMPRSIANFWIFGHGCENNAGIKAELTSGKVSGIRFENIGFTNMGAAFDLQGFWHSSISRCYAIGGSGVIMRGQNVKITIFDNVFIKHVDVNGSYEPNGISVVFANNQRSEDVNISKNLTFGFDIGCWVEQCLMLNILENDFDYCKVEGVKVQTIDAILNINNNWIAQYSGMEATHNFNGINIVPLGSPNNYSKNIIGNTIFGSQLGGYGINVRNNQRNVNVIGNTITNSIISCYIETDGVNVNGNTFDSTGVGLFIGYTANAAIDNNFFSSGVISAVSGLGNSGINLGKNNHGAVSTGFKKQLTLPANTSTISGTLSSLGVATLYENPSKLKPIVKNITADSNFDYGKVNLTVTETDYTLTVTNQNSVSVLFFVDVECVLV